MNDEMREILRACSSTEPATFGEFLHGLPDPPEKGDKHGWSSLFRKLDILERDGYVEIERDGNNRISSLLLTEEGVEAVRPPRRPDPEWPDIVG